MYQQQPADPNFLPQVYPRRGGRGRGRRPRRAYQKPRQEAPPPTKLVEEVKEKQVSKSELKLLRIQLSITTRCIGLFIQYLFYILQSNNINVNCTCFNLYRVCLYTLSAKLINQAKLHSPWFQIVEAQLFVLEHLRSLISTYLSLPGPLVGYLDSIGSFELNSVAHSAFVPSFQGSHPVTI